MLESVGYPSLDALIDATVPEVIRRREPLDLPSPLDVPPMIGHDPKNEEIELTRAPSSDEPFSALDVGLRLELYALLREQVEQRRSAVLAATWLF